MSPAGRPAQTSPEAWVQAALDEIEEAGVGALSVQSVARRLGVSKGGLYHHFEDRRALLRAALDLWERRFVIELVERFDEIADPRDRLRALLDYSGVELEPTVIVQLMAAAGDPDVAARLRRAADSRMALLQRIFRELGLSSARCARSRGDRLQRLPWAGPVADPCARGAAWPRTPPQLPERTRKRVTSRLRLNTASASTGSSDVAWIVMRGGQGIPGDMLLLERRTYLGAATCQGYLAADLSALPARSVARTLRMWRPTLSPSNLSGDRHLRNLAPSRLH